MRRNENITESTRRTSGEAREIEERLLDEGERSPQSMESAAEDAFVREQRVNAAHPTRRQRELDREHEVENPSHSEGI